MTEGHFPWPEIGLKPDRVIAESHVFRGLRQSCLQRIEGKRRYALVCGETALKFSVELTGILSEHDDQFDPYSPRQALTNLHQALDGAQGPVLFQFLRYSPWLIASLEVRRAKLRPVHQGVMLARLLNLLVTLIEERGLTGGRLRDPYRLLLRARFLVLARLSQKEHRVEAMKYLPELDLQVREAWRAWGQTMLRAPEEMSMVLARYGRKAEEEGRLLLFQPQGEALWPFACGKGDLPFTELLLTRWFLPRYDLNRTLRVLSQLPEPKEAMPPSGRVKRILYRLRLRVARRWRQLLPALQVPVSLVAVLLLGLPLILPQRLWLCGALVVAIGLALAAIVQIVLLGTRPLRYTLPRITLATLVGYLALVSSDEIMTFAIEAYDHHPLLAWATTLGSTMVAFLAIYVEARRRLETGRLAWPRAFRVLAIAAARSLALGWLILAPAGSLLLAGTEVIKRAQSWEGPVGGPPIYPQLIFVLAPLALFVGIFVQTIWEEYPLTHPI